jgi:hypothetical protein
LLPTAAYYTGLAAIRAGLGDLTGLSPFASGVVIIGVARVLTSACFFLVAERVTGSGRAAAGASLVYAANPMFLFWRFQAPRASAGQAQPGWFHKKQHQQTRRDS